MDKTRLLLIAPEKLRDLKEEIESIKRFKEKQVFMQISNTITDLKELNTYLENYIDLHDVILIFESITESRANIEKAQSELLENIRKIKIINYDVKIVVILQTEKEKNTNFINELIKLDVQNFYFINTFSKDDIAAWVLGEAKTLKDNLKYISTEIRKTEKEVITKEVAKYIEVPISSKETQRTSSYVIGIVGASHGSGATSLCVNYATHLREQGYNVLLLDRTDNQQLSKIQIKGQEIKDCSLSDVDIEEYDYIVIDFGIIAEINYLGTVVPTLTMTDERRIERKYCNEIILTISCLPWRIFEINAYIQNEIFSRLTSAWIFYINGEKNLLFENHKKAFEKLRVLLTAYENNEPNKELENLIESRRKI